MSRRPVPGLAVWFVTDLGFAVALATHDVPKTGTLIWIAGPVFDEVPTIDDVMAIDSWRWPVFFPLSAALHRKLFTRIGVVEIPLDLQTFPVIRRGAPSTGWTKSTIRDGVEVRLGPTEDRHLPIGWIVNDTALKEMVVAGWIPEDVF